MPDRPDRGPRRLAVARRVDDQLAAQLGEHLEPVLRAFLARLTETALDALFERMRPPPPAPVAEVDTPVDHEEAARQLGIRPRTLRDLERSDPRYRALRLKTPGVRKRVYSSRLIAELRALR